MRGKAQSQAPFDGAQCKPLSKLIGLDFTEALQAIAKLALERHGRVGIEGDEVPERLRFVLAEIGERTGVGIRVARNVFADRAVRVASQAAQSLGVGARMFADQAEEIEIFFGSLLGELFEHFRLGFGTENKTDFFVPGGIDVIQLARAGVDEFFKGAPLLLQACDRKASAFERIQNAEQMLAFTKDNLRSAQDFAVFLFLVLHEIGTSHGSLLPIPSGDFSEWDILT
jgi:hypothetical protein